MKITELYHGQLFTLPCEKNRAIYALLGIEWKDGKETGPISHARIQQVADWWPEGGVGPKGTWIACTCPEQKYNPYAEAKALKLPDPE